MKEGLKYGVTRGELILTVALGVTTMFVIPMGIAILQDLAG